MTESRSRESSIRRAVRRHAGLVPVGDSPRGDGDPERHRAYVRRKEEEIVRRIAEADPTSCGTYVDWLVATWREGRWGLEDIDRVRDDLSLFDRRRARIGRDDPGAVDISRYAGPQALVPVIRPYRTPAPVRAALERPEMMAEPQARILRDDGLFHVVRPLTAEASAFWGWDAEWCITWGVPGSRHPTRRGYFDAYTENGNAFLFVTHRRDGSLWAIQMEKDGVRLWDADDNQVRSPLATILSGEWYGLMEGAVLDEIALVMTDFPVRGIAALGRKGRDRILEAMENGSCGSEDRPTHAWDDASPEERRLGIRFWPDLVLHLPDVRPEERLEAIAGNPHVIRRLPGATGEERIAALRRRPGLFDQIGPLSAEERAALIGIHPEYATRMPGLSEEERILILRADVAMLIRLAPLSPRERWAAIEVCPEAATILARLTPEEHDLAVRGGLLPARLQSSTRRAA